MIDGAAIVRFACLDCRTIFDIDLVAISRRRGRDFRLVDEFAQCKVSGCRGHGRFIYAPADDRPFMLLVDRADVPMPGWMIGLRPIDVDAPDSPPFPPVARPSRARRLLADSEVETSARI